MVYSLSAIVELKMHGPMEAISWGFFVIFSDQANFIFDILVSKDKNSAGVYYSMYNVYFK